MIQARGQSRIHGDWPHGTPWTRNPSRPRAIRCLGRDGNAGSPAKNDPEFFFSLCALDRLRASSSLRVKEARQEITETGVLAHLPSCSAAGFPDWYGKRVHAVLCASECRSLSYALLQGTPGTSTKSAPIGGYSRDLR